MEANPERGELAVTVTRDDGTEKVYVLRMRMNSLCALQQRTKKSYGELIADLSMMNVESVRELMWALLTPYHANEFKSINLVGELIDDLGGHVKATSIITDLLVLNRPKKEIKPKADGDANPPTAGTGLGLSETGSAAA